MAEGPFGPKRCQNCPADAVPTGPAAARANDRTYFIGQMTSVRYPSGFGVDWGSAK
jgi:hypothetical protein